MDINTPFPPILDQRSNMPTGHLRPLGWQNRAEFEITEESVSIEPVKFWDFYLEKSKPVIIRGLVSGSDIIERWTDIYLSRHYGTLDIKVTNKKQTNHEDKIQMSINNFLKGYRVEDWYLNVIIPNEMLSEVPLPHIINCGPFAQDDKNDGNLYFSKISQLIESHLWISAGETSSLLHSQPYHNLHCVFDGRKDFILIPKEQFETDNSLNDWKELLDLQETTLHSSYWYSKINVDMVNAYKYKILQNLVWNWASLRAGDCVYIPANYLHQQRSHGRGIATSIYLTLLKTTKTSNLNEVKTRAFESCEQNAPLFEPISLFTNNFIWAYTHSERHISPRNFTDDNNVRLILLYLSKEENLYFEVFDNFYKEITNEMKESQVNEIQFNYKEVISLNSQDIWRDFFDRTQTSISEKQESFLTIRQILQLNKVNFKNFKKVLLIASQYHNLVDHSKKGKLEL
jgi:lysine-specific demethylase 8